MTKWFAGSLLLAACAAAAAYAQAPSRTIWVLGADSQQPSITQVDANFKVIRTVAVPKAAVDHPEYLSVNRRGQWLYVLPAGIEFADGAETANKVWYFGGAIQPPFERQQSDERPRMWFLDAGGDGLYALEVRHTKTLDADGNDATIRSGAQLFRGSPNGTSLTAVVALPDLPLCKCATGVCSETCPEWNVWAPENGIGDFFLATRIVAGQLQSDVQETLLYRRSGGWRATKLPEALESPIDASPDGEMLLAAVFDSGCCGWVNESSDQLRLIRNGKSTIVVFDEFSRYDNHNYDVSFSAAHAKLSPSGAQVAYTISPSQSPADEIRLSADGKDNNQELARVRQTMAALPIIEIAAVADPARVIAVIPGAQLAGWLNDRELLVVQDGRLAIYDTRGAKVRQSSIEARSAAAVFLR